MKKAKVHVVQEIINCEAQNPQIFASKAKAKKEFLQIAQENDFDNKEVTMDTCLSTDNYEVFIWFDVIAN